MKTRKLTMFVLLVTAIAVIAGTTPANAAPANTGFDDVPDVVVGGGSDTTYNVMQRLETLWNAAPGCNIVTSSTSADKGKCALPATGDVLGNFDHDLMVSAAATGSSAGVVSLLSTGTPYNPAIDYARSSRGSSGTELEQLTFWGYARDGIAVLTFGTRTGVSLTKQDLKDIYLCNKTDWSQFGGAPGTIIPWDMNTSSGTYASFRTYLDNITFGPCVRKLAGGAAPFENDVKPILADPGPDGTPNTADDNENNMLWWMSFGAWSSYPYVRSAQPTGAPAVVNSQLVAVEGTTPSASTISGNTYAILRTLYHVTRNVDADCRQTAGTAGACDNVGAEVYGADTGKRGAVREFTEFLCRTSNTEHTTNITTGRKFRSEIVSALNLEGFQQVPATGGLRTPGYSCSVQS